MTVFAVRVKKTLSWEVGACCETGDNDPLHVVALHAGLEPYHSQTAHSTSHLVPLL